MITNQAKTKLQEAVEKLKKLRLMSHKCTCDIRKLMICGCKCGGS
jgi:hypothetical protein